MGLVWIFKKLIFGNLFATERGRIKLFHKMDWTLFPSRALAMNLQTIGEKLGEEFLYKLGYQAGKDAAKEMIKYMRLKPRGGWIKCLESYASIDGDYWSFKGKAVREHVHAYFQYPAMMVPQMQGELIRIVRNIVPDIKTVFDPFVGSGTTMTEAMLQGLDLAKERMKNFFDYFTRRLNELDESKIDKDYLNSEEFAELFMQGAEQAARSTTLSATQTPTQRSDRS